METWDCIPRLTLCGLVQRCARRCAPHPHQCCGGHIGPLTSPSPVQRRAHRALHLTLTCAATCTPGPSPVQRCVRRAPHLDVHTGPLTSPSPVQRRAHRAPHPHLCSDVHTGLFTCAATCTPGPSPRRAHQAPHLTHFRQFKWEIVILV